MEIEEVEKELKGVDDEIKAKFAQRKMLASPQRQKRTELSEVLAQLADEKKFLLEQLEGAVKARTIKEATEIAEKERVQQEQAEAAEKQRWERAEVEKEAAAGRERKRREEEEAAEVAAEEGGRKEERRSSSCERSGEARGRRERGGRKSRSNYHSEYVVSRANIYFK
jgi:colicin import membrane protein